MGDKGNIRIDENGKSIYLYTHWGGSEISTYLQKALARRDRWDDPAYLARIIFCEMLKGLGGDVLDGTTGFGISTQICDNEHDILVVDTDQQKVFIEHKPGIEWTFEEYANGVNIS